MSDKLPPCDHDECGLLKCSKLSDTPRTDKFKKYSVQVYQHQNGTILTVHEDDTKALERENNQLLTKLVIAETTCDELAPLIEKNNQLREALKVFRDGVRRIAVEYPCDSPDEPNKLARHKCEQAKTILSNPIVQASLKKQTEGAKA